MISILSLHNAVGDGRDDLQNAINEMIAHLKLEASLDKKETDKILGELASSIKENDDCFKESTEDVAEFQEQIAKSKKTQAVCRGTISKLELRQTELSTAITKHQSRGAKDAVSYKNRQSDDAAAIAACNQAIALLKTYPGVSNKAMFL